ncbi:MAG: hypothetical protein ACKV2V_22675 [Blastocatellia bacterium]
MLEYEPIEHKLTDKKDFLVGINYPWINYGWDFGAPPPAWIGEHTVAEWRKKQRAQIVADMRQIADLGLFAVRWFILGDGLNYGMGEHGPKFDHGKWNFIPPPPEDDYYKQLYDDFEFVVDTLSALKLKFVPSLVDFHMFFKPRLVDETHGIIKGGRLDIATCPLTRELFFNHVLDPLLDISMKYQDTFYAWELINEPEWCTRNSWSFLNRLQPPQFTQSIPQKLMRRFMVDGIKRMTARVTPEGKRALCPTVGFGHWHTLNLWDEEELGIGMHQIHYYAQEDRDLTTTEDLYLKVPSSIGEFASAIGKPWPELDREGQEQSLKNRLDRAIARGFVSAFLWSMRGEDEATLWDDSVRAAIVSYIAEQRELGAGVVA